MTSLKAQIPLRLTIGRKLIFVTHSFPSVVSVSANEGHMIRTWWDSVTGSVSPEAKSFPNTFDYTL